MTEDTPSRPPLVPRKPRGGLGRGLSALLGDSMPEDRGSHEPADTRDSGGIRTLPVSALTPHPGQPRRHFDDAGLQDLADSIASRGILQPIVVRPHGKDFQIVAGERRWRAAQRARLHEVPVIVRDLDEAETLEIALVENIQRQDLNAIEEADAYKKLIAEFGHTQEALARIVHKSRSHVANLLRLLDLPDGIQGMVAEGALSMGHARALIGAPDAEALADQVRDRGLSVRDTEKLVRQSRPREPVDRTPRGRDGGGSAVGYDADIEALERHLGDVLGLKVKVAHTDKVGGGTVTLAYSTLDQLDMVCQRLTGDAI